MNKHNFVLLFSLGSNLAIALRSHWQRQQAEVSFTMDRITFVTKMASGNLDL